MWLNLSGNAATWQEALLPHLKDAEQWLRSQLQRQRDVEEAVQEALAAVCLRAAHAWRPGQGVKLALRFAVYHVCEGNLTSGLGLGYGARRNRVKTRSLSSGWEESVHGRELSPVQAAQWTEVREAVGPLLAVAAERIASGDSVNEGARVARMEWHSFRASLRKKLARFRQG